MRQKKFFRNFFLVGMAIILFGVSSCDTPNDTSKNKARLVAITKVTIKGQEFDVSIKQDIVLPSSVESLIATDVTSVKGKVEGKGAEVDLQFDKITPETVSVTAQGTPFLLYTKATKEYKVGSIALKAIKSTSQETTFNVNFSVTPSDAATLTATVAGSAINTGDPVAKDATVTFALVITKPNYKVKDWAGSADLTPSSDKMGATLVVKENTTISVTLEEETQPAKDVTVNSDVELGSDNQKHGSIAVFKGTDAVPNGTKVKVGDTLKVVASPATNYEVEAWKINDVTKENETGKFITVPVLEEHATAGLKITVKYKLKS